MASVLTATGCTGFVGTGPPLDDPVAVVRRASLGGAVTPATVRFEWRYGDRRGRVEGEGIARFNPPDSLRLDLFTSGDLALAVSLAGDSLATLGEIEDVELPSPPFLYAMAGIFRPAAPEPTRGYVSGEDEVLVYGNDRSETTYFFLREGRLRRLEQRRAGRTLRRVVVEWHAEGEWPRRAEYRDLAARSRVRWEMGKVRATAPHPKEIYELTSSR